MRPTLHIIASCTDGKRLPVPPQLRLRTHRRVDVAVQFERWWSALTQHDGPSAPAEQLYVGDHWSVAREIPAVAESHGWNAQLWALSAGYGLVPAEARLSPYAATFQPGHADSVARTSRGERRIDQQRWWTLLAEQPGPMPGAPRSVAELLRAGQHATVLIAASRQYLLSVESDLLDAIGYAGAQRRLLVVSSEPVGVETTLRDHWVTTDARLQRRLGGSRLSLHIRTARWIAETVERHRMEPRAVREMVARALRRAPPPRTYDRAPVTDQQVREFICKALSSNPRATHTGLLRQFRSGGRACEQSRFRALFHDVARGSR